MGHLCTLIRQQAHSFRPHIAASAVLQVPDLKKKQETYVYRRSFAVSRHEKKRHSPLHTEPQVDIYIQRQSGDRRPRHLNRHSKNQISSDESALRRGGKGRWQQRTPVHRPVHQARPICTKPAMLCGPLHATSVAGCSVNVYLAGRLPRADGCHQPATAAAREIAVNS